MNGGGGGGRRDGRGGGWGRGREGGSGAGNEGGREVIAHGSIRCCRCRVSREHCGRLWGGLHSPTGWVLRRCVMAAAVEGGVLITEP